MHPAALPTIADIGGLFAYIVSNPYLFIGSTTGMTSGLILGAMVVSVLPQRTAVLSRVAPALALILVYFGIGSVTLALEIFVRFRTTTPFAVAVEIQLVSGFLHLLEAAVGIAVLLPYLRRRTRSDWLWGHTVALGYLTFQVAVLTPPWFSFHGQRELVLGVVMTLLALAATINVFLWLSPRKEPSRSRR